MTVPSVRAKPSPTQRFTNACPTAKRYARRADRFAVGHAFVNLCVGEGFARTDGTVIHQRASRDDFCAAGDWDLRIAKTAIWSAVAHPQLRNLACSARRGVLVALAAGLRVVKRAQTVLYRLYIVKPRLVSLMSRIIHQTVALVVEAGGSLRALLPR